MRIALTITAAAFALAACQPERPVTNENTSVEALNADMTANVNTADKDGMMDTAVNTADASLTTTPGDFVKNAATGDMFEVMSSKLAVMSATDPKIKAFAREMVDEHTKSTRELKAARSTDNQTEELPTALDAGHQALIDVLRKQTGAQFDATYKAQQIDSHTKTLALMRSFASSGTGALKAHAAKTAPAVEMHLKMAQGL